MNPVLFAIPVLLYLLNSSKSGTISQTYGNATAYKTWDKYTNQRIAKLHPNIRQAVYSAILDLQAQGIKARVASGLRTFAEQAALFIQRPIVTKANSGQSMHNYGLAVDVYEVINGKLDERNRSKITAAFKKQGFEAGADWTSFKDTPHYQKSYGNSWQTLLNKQKEGKIKEGYVIV